MVGQTFQKERSDDGQACFGKAEVPTYVENQEPKKPLFLWYSCTTKELCNEN
jgi:hypothetical protein